LRKFRDGKKSGGGKNVVVTHTDGINDKGCGVALYKSYYDGSFDAKRGGAGSTEPGTEAA
jgi:hypothetical protein